METLVPSTVKTMGGRTVGGMVARAWEWTPAGHPMTAPTSQSQQRHPICDFRSAVFDWRFWARPLVAARGTERGCVVLDQPQHAAGSRPLRTSHALRLVFDTAALRQNRKSKTEGTTAPRGRSAADQPAHRGS